MRALIDLFSWILPSCEFVDLREYFVDRPESYDSFSAKTCARKNAHGLRYISSFPYTTWPKAINSYYYRIMVRLCMGIKKMYPKLCAKNTQLLALNESLLSGLSTKFSRRATISQLNFTSYHRHLYNIIYSIRPPSDIILYRAYSIRPPSDISACASNYSFDDRQQFNWFNARIIHN
jgi:hypothetical protein